MNTNKTKDRYAKRLKIEDIDLILEVIMVEESHFPNSVARLMSDGVRMKCSECNHFNPTVKETIAHTNRLFST